MTMAVSGTGGAVMAYVPRFSVLELVHLSDLADVRAELSGSDRNVADEIMR